MEKNFQQKLFDELYNLLEPFRDASADTDSLFHFFEWVGWDIETILGGNNSSFISNVQVIVNSIDEIKTLAEDPPDTLLEFASALDVAFKTTKALKEIPNTISGFSSIELDKIALDILDKLFQIYLLKYHRKVFYALELLNVIHDSAVTQVEKNGTVVRFEPAQLKKLSISKIGDLFSDPSGYLKAAYPAYRLSNTNEAKSFASQLFPILSRFLREFNIQAFYGRGEGPVELTPAEEDRLATMLGLKYRYYNPITDKTDVAEFILKLIPATEDGPGILISPFGEINFFKALKNWNIYLEVDNLLEGFLIKSDGITTYGNISNANIAFAISSNAVDGKYLIGSSSGTRLEVGKLNFSTGVDTGTYGLEFSAENASFVISTENSFLSYILPADGLKINFNLGIGWNNKKGLYLKGSGGLDALIPVHKSFFNTIELETIRLLLSTNGSEITTSAGVALNAKLGILNASIQDAGLKADFTFPATGGNLGVANVDLGFKSPTGIGITLNSDIVSGGGFLSLDSAKGQYAGVLNLNIKDRFSVTAIGILLTKLPNGQSGYSFLALINVTFNPGIQLGYGFVLEGLGGILGINRSMSTAAIQAGVRNNTISSALIPANPVENAPRIINDLNAFFPVQVGRYVFGVLGRISWGTPALIRADIAFIIEVPDPIKVAIIGRAVSVLPTEAASVVRLEANFAGIMDFGTKSLSFDASLVNSRVLSFTISGDMILRVKGGNDPNFVLSIGGFHPSYRPPASLNIPSLRRLSITIANSSNFRIGADGYFAITSNSLQFGARAYFYASVGSFSVDGQIGFDALVKVSPFYISVSVYASLSLRYDGDELCGVGANVTLTGPTPWHAYGTVTFSIWIFDYTKSFDKTFGNSKSPVSLPNVNILPQLVQALADKNNWQATLPTSKSNGVALYEVPEGPNNEIIVNPASVISISQKVVPLKMTIEKFGEGKPIDGTNFAISGATFGTSTAGSLTDVKDFFAPGSFKTLNDSQKLSAPSFEKLNSGVQFGVSGSVKCGTGIIKEVKYERIIIDKPDQKPRVRFKYSFKHAELLRAFSLQIGGAAVAKSALSSINKANLTNALAAAAERFAITNVDSAGMIGTTYYASKTEANDAVKNMLFADPTLEEKLNVVSEFEIS